MKTTNSQLSRFRLLTQGVPFTPLQLLAPPPPPFPIPITQCPPCPSTHPLVTTVTKMGYGVTPTVFTRLPAAKLQFLHHTRIKTMKWRLCFTLETEETRKLGLAILTQKRSKAGQRLTCTTTAPKLLRRNHKTQVHAHFSNRNPLTEEPTMTSHEPMQRKEKEDLTNMITNEK